MRPLPGDNAAGRPRTSDPDCPSLRLPPAPNMTYFLADESARSALPQPPPVSPHRPKENRRAPIPDCPETPKSRGPSHHDERDKEHRGRPSSSKDLWPHLDTFKHDGHYSSRPISPFPRSSDTPDLSQPLTPVLLGASGPASVLSSVSSRRNSLCLSEDLDSRPLSMKDGEIGQEEGQGEDTEGPSGSSMMDSGSAPQLIMPSIKMPSRRPFTDEGKRMGRLKVLIAGDSGVGKTSLIKAIVQSCEHIVHVDPITPGSLMSSSMTRSVPLTIGASGSKQRGRRQSSRDLTGTSQITEVYASTKPYPEWWSEVDDFRILRRRKSLGDTVLDRNICFVDTPGYGSGSSSMDTITPVAEYIEAHLKRIHSNLLSDGDLLNLLGGEGGVQVDAVFYMVSNRLRPVDIEYLRQLAPLTNIILLLAQTDLMSPEQITSSKEQIYCQLKEADIRLFSLSMPSPSYPSSDPDKQGIYAISSIAGSDHDTMDASLLMSPDYVQPLISTELAALVNQVFSSNGVSWLRHSVARKYVQWRANNHPSQSPPQSPSLRPPSALLRQPLNLPTSLSQSPNPFPGTATPPISSSYALARLADHTQREERLAQVCLANWAADLQKSLAREREQYAALARAERASWLAERIGECLREGTQGLGVDGSLVPLAAQGVERVREANGEGSSSHRGLSSRRSRYAGGRGRRRGEGLGQSQYQHSQQHQQRHGQRQRQDPLGLLEVADELRYKGLLALEVLGSIGVLGGLALWVTRHYFQMQGGEWEKFWYGCR